MAEQPNIIVRKKKKVVAGGHHGGAWKIAYADFVTAMMAFFLLMWLLGSTSKADLQGISEYFQNPLKVSLAGGSGAGEAQNIIKLGGGTDMTRAEGQQMKGNDSKEKMPYDLKAAQQEAERQEKEMLEDLKKRIETLIDNTPSLRDFKRQLLIDITSEGLRIQIVDEQNRPMFSLGKAELQPYTKELLHAIASVLNQVPNKISLAGHTDATPYVGGDRGYSNWELSADRANASRRELIFGGLAEGKMLRVVGLSSAVLLNKNDALDPINRRISIIVLNHRTEQALMEDKQTVDVNSGDPTSVDQIPNAAGLPPAAAAAPAKP